MIEAAHGLHECVIIGIHSTDVPEPEAKPYHRTTNPNTPTSRSERPNNGFYGPTSLPSGLSLWGVAAVGGRRTLHLCHRNQVTLVESRINPGSSPPAGGKSSVGLRFANPLAGGDHEPVSLRTTKVPNSVGVWVNVFGALPIGWATCVWVIGIATEAPE